MDNTYIVEQLAPVGPTIEVVDDGTGTDWIVISKSHKSRSDITLMWTSENFRATSAAGTYWTDKGAGRLIVKGRIENARGGPAADYISGNERNNRIEGDPTRTGPGGNDVLFGDDGDDLMYGGAGSDELNGAEGNDRLYGGPGDDKSLSGSSGIDVVHGGPGADGLSGGASIGDTVSYADSPSAVRIDITYGSTTIGRGGDAAGDRINGFTDVIGSSFADVIVDTVKGEISFDYNKNRFSGGDGADRLYLGGGDDTGIGGNGNDVLWGEQGNDALSGGADRDLLIGGPDGDKLTGGAGPDTFVLRSLSDSTPSGAGRDEIRDFRSSALDIIDLSAIDANTRQSDNQPFTFIGSAAFSGKPGQLRAVIGSVDTTVTGDVNGDRKADFGLLLRGKVKLGKANFRL